MNRPSEEAQYIYHERMGIGIDLGMTEEEAKVQAVKEAMEYERASPDAPAPGSTQT